MASVAQITTAEQLLETPGLGRCELLRGELVMMTPAGFEHGRIVSAITAPLAVFVKEHGLGMTTGAETGFQIGRDPDTVRAPDVGFLGTARAPKKKVPGFFQALPIWPSRSFLPTTVRAKFWPRRELALSRLPRGLGCRSRDGNRHRLFARRQCHNVGIVRHVDRRRLAAGLQLASGRDLRSVGRATDAMGRIPESKCRAHLYSATGRDP